MAAPGPEAKLGMRASAADDTARCGARGGCISSGSHENARRAVCQYSPILVFPSRPDSPLAILRRRRWMCAACAAARPAGSDAGTPMGAPPCRAACSSGASPAWIGVKPSQRTCAPVSGGTESSAAAAGSSVVGSGRALPSSARPASSWVRRGAGSCPSAPGVPQAHSSSGVSAANRADRASDPSEPDAPPATAAAAAGCTLGSRAMAINASVSSATRAGDASAREEGSSGRQPPATARGGTAAPRGAPTPASPAGTSPAAAVPLPAAWGGSRSAPTATMTAHSSWCASSCPAPASARIRASTCDD
mmetsp:Transcript_18520/g.60660  ORF Transcript_18520/g.60660 Transcript_18520/m.60660 type:complete len:306 (+) Transcript_18520:1313-2230(+)